MIRPNVVKFQSKGFEIKFTVIMICKDHDSQDLLVETTKMVQNFAKEPLLSHFLGQKSQLCIKSSDFWSENVMKCDFKVLKFS